ncbi:hypothetical protein PV326_003889 [Microctonus aethiopoides]|nr:hypothetical protein PV326_003889 [Microctonus aethiopoides]
MENEDYYPHPNTNADIYRNMTAADRGTISDKHLQFLSIYDDNTAILGGSNFIDRYWSGTVWLFTKNINYERKNAAVTTRTESAVCDGDFLNHSKFIVAEDSGVIQILEVSKSSDTWKPTINCSAYVCQHDDGITSLAVFNNKLNFVTCGMDYCIKLWEASELVAEHSYSFAHTNIITSVDVKPASDSVFISTSLDCEAVVWDVRESKPATGVFKSEGNGLTAVAWDPSNEHNVAIGALDGSVILIDTREPNKIVSESIAFPRPVHKLNFHPKNNWLAGCCDDSVVKILDPMKELIELYKDTQHKDFVRDVAWQKDELLTCSWDDTVLKHNFPSTKIE